MYNTTIAVIIVIIIIIAVGIYLYKRDSDELPTPPVQPSTPGNTNPPKPPVTPPTQAVYQQIQSNWTPIYNFFAVFTQSLKELSVAFQTLNTPMNKNDIDILKSYGYSGSYNTNLMEHYAPGDNDSAQYKTAYAAWSNAQNDINTLVKTIGITNSSYTPSVTGTLNANIAAYSASTALTQFQQDQASILGITNLFPLAANIGKMSATSAPTVGHASPGVNIQIFLQYIYYIMTNMTNSAGNPSNWQYGSSNTTPTDGLVNFENMLQNAYTAGASFTVNATTKITIYDAYILIMKASYEQISDQYSNIGQYLNDLLELANLYS